MPNHKQVNFYCIPTLTRILEFLLIVHISVQLECHRCEGDYAGVRCSNSCLGEQCLVWKWKSKSELIFKQGCLSGVDRRFTSKVGCRTNYLGASLCVCEDGDYCNRIERIENTLRPLPTIRLPLVECFSKVTGSDIFGSRREHMCSANYCHMTHTETYTDNSAPDVLNVYKCGDMAEFDFDVRIRNSVAFPGLYSNGCYKIQSDPKEIITDCTCAKNNCNSGIPVVISGPVRCYLGNSLGNETQITEGKFCDGDYCFMQKNGNLYSKGCISVNERNSWSHLKSGYRHIVGVDQWLCQNHLCNYDLKRIQRSIIPIEDHPLPSMASKTSDFLMFITIFMFFSM